MAPAIQVRPVLESELPTLLAFAHRTFLASYAHLNTPENIAAYEAAYFTPRRIATEFNHPQSQFFFAERTEEIVGYVKLNWGKAQTEDHLPAGLEIERIYVAPEAQGQGIGAQLLAQAHRSALQLACDPIWLGVWEKNTGAIRFYERHGFRPFGRHVFQLGDDPQVDVMMWTHPLAPSL